MESLFPDRLLLVQKASLSLRLSPQIFLHLKHSLQWILIGLLPFLWHASLVQAHFETARHRRSLRFRRLNSWSAYFRKAKYLAEGEEIPVLVLRVAAARVDPAH